MAAIKSHLLLPFGSKPTVEFLQNSTQSKIILSYNMISHAIHKKNWNAVYIAECKGWTYHLRLGRKFTVGEFLSIAQSRELSDSEVWMLSCCCLLVRERAFCRYPSFVRRVRPSRFTGVEVWRKLAVQPLQSHSSRLESHPYMPADLQPAENRGSELEFG